MAQSDAYSRVVILPQSNYLLSLMTIIRNEATGTSEFVNAFDKVCQQLLPAGGLFREPQPSVTKLIDVTRLVYSFQCSTF